MRNIVGAKYHIITEENININLEKGKQYTQIMGPFVANFTIDDFKKDDVQLALDVFVHLDKEQVMEILGIDDDAIEDWLKSGAIDFVSDFLEIDLGIKNADVSFIKMESFGTEIDEALEIKEADYKKPVHNPGAVFRCPSCKRVWSSDQNTDRLSGFILKFCPSCGTDISEEPIKAEIVNKVLSKDIKSVGSILLFEV